MSAAHQYMALCPDVQQNLDNYFLTCNSANLREPAPFFEAMMSPLNRGNLSQEIAPGGGKVKTVVLRYDQRKLESDVTQPGTCERSCVATNRTGDLTTSYTIDPCAYYEESERIKSNDFTYACRNNPEIVAGIIQRMIDVLVRRIQTETTSDAASLVGKWNSLITTSTSPAIGSGSELNMLLLNTLKSGSTDINPFAFEDLNGALMQSNICQLPMIFSGMTFYKYARIMNAGCCSNQGVDLQRLMDQSGMAVFYDRRVEAAASGGINGAWAVAPGALQIITYNENDNGVSEAAGVTVGANYQKQIIYDPRTSLPIDLDISDNCGTVSIFVRANAKIVSVPTDLYAPGDQMAGVTGFMGIKIKNS